MVFFDDLVEWFFWFQSAAYGFSRNSDIMVLVCFQFSSIFGCRNLLILKYISKQSTFQPG